MNCRDVQRLGEWPNEDEPAGRHLATCVSCREELTAQVRLRARLRTAFDHASVLEPTSDFAVRLHANLARVAVAEWPRRTMPRQWLALAATVAVMIGLATATLLHRSAQANDRLASDAVGDHWNCALRYRLIRRPMRLDEAARRYDPAFRLFLDQPPGTISTRVGKATVVERHSCAFDARRFGHVILQYRGHVVSLLLTGLDVNPGHDSNALSVGGFTVLSAPAADHVLLLVGDLTREDLEPLAQVMSSVFVPKLKAVDRIPVPDARAVSDAIALRQLTLAGRCCERQRS